MAHDVADAAGRDDLVGRIADFDGVSLDAGVMALSVVGLIGNLLDVRSHDAGVSFAEEGFLTVPHVIFYSAFAGVALLIAAVTVANRLSGASREEAVPDGYRLGLVGVVLFALGGPGDALWHAAFHAESGVEALTSPTHLLLATGAVLFLSSPLRRAWGIADLRGRAQVPMLLSAAFTLTGITIITLYAHPVFGDQWVTGGTQVSLGVASVAFQSAVLAGVLLTLVLRFDLVPGAFALVLGVNGAAMTWVGASFALLPGIVLVGLLADGLYVVLDPSAERPLAVRAFVTAVPMAYYAAYFATLEATAGIAWTVHVWAGSIVLAGFAGLLSSYVALPSSDPVDVATTGADD